jgi:hypothetical protein
MPPARARTARTRGARARVTRRPIGGVRPEEAEACMCASSQVVRRWKGRRPGIPPAPPAACNPRHGARVHHVEVGTPVVPAGPRHRGPPEDGVTLSAGTAQGSSGLPARSCRAARPEIAVPDASWRSKSAKARERHEVDPVGRRRRAHGQERGTTSLCKRAGGSSSSRRWLRARPGELIQREFRAFGHACAILPDATPPFCGTNRHRGLSAHRECGPRRKGRGKIARK